MGIAEQFAVLGLPSAANEEQVRRAYRKLVMKWHPDRFATRDARTREAAHEHTRQLAQAYAAIRDHFQAATKAAERESGRPASGASNGRYPSEPRRRHSHWQSRPGSSAAGAPEPETIRPWQLAVARVSVKLTLPLVAAGWLVLAVWPRAASDVSSAPPEEVPFISFALLTVAVLAGSAVGMYRASPSYFVISFVYVDALLLHLPLLAPLEILLIVIAVAPAAAGAVRAMLYHDSIGPAGKQLPFHWWLSSYSVFLFIVPLVQLPKMLARNDPSTASLLLFGLVGCGYAMAGPICTAVKRQRRKV